MSEAETGRLEYLRTVFKGLPAEKQDQVLNTARSLLEIQEDNISSPCMQNPHPKVKNREV